MGSCVTLPREVAIGDKLASQNRLSSLTNHLRDLIMFIVTLFLFPINHQSCEYL